MALNIYKPGQGYWTRLLSGVGGGILVVGGAVWLVRKLETLDLAVETMRYIQAGIFVVVLAVFGFLVYRAVGLAPRTSDFLIATEGEMKKVNWPNQKEVTGSTWVVIWCLILMTGLLFSSDLIFSSLFRAIGILEQ